MKKRKRLTRPKTGSTITRGQIGQKLLLKFKPSKRGRGIIAFTNTGKVCLIRQGYGGIMPAAGSTWLVEIRKDFDSFNGVEPILDLEQASLDQLLACECFEVVFDFREMEFRVLSKLGGPNELPEVTRRPYDQRWNEKYSEFCIEGEPLKYGQVIRLRQAMLGFENDGVIFFYEDDYISSLYRAFLQRKLMTCVKVEAKVNGNFTFLDDKARRAYAKMTGKAKFVSFIGDFSVSHNEMRRQVEEVAFFIDFTTDRQMVYASDKTHMLFVGGDSISDVEIKAAETAGAVVFREADLARIIRIIEGFNPEHYCKSGYVSYRARSSKGYHQKVFEGRVVEVGINHVVDVYNDYVKWEISEDGWDLAGAFGIIENWLYSFQTPALISYLLEFIGVKVLKGYEPKFSKAFFRLLLLDTLHMLLEEGGIGCEFIVTPDELLDSDFTSKFWNYIRFYDPREREIASKTENVNDWLTNIILKDREMNQIFSGK